MTSFFDGRHHRAGRRDVSVRLQVHLAAVYVPEGMTIPDGDATSNAYYDLAGNVVGGWFKVLVTLTSALIAIFANSIASQATSSRLVFSMARDRQLPRILSKVTAHGVPRNAMLSIVLLSLVIGSPARSSRNRSRRW
jgi:amino acid transporter